MIEMASAPLRVDFSGGYTDVPEVFRSMGGVAANVALGMRTFVYRRAPWEAAAGSAFDAVSSFQARRDSPQFAERLLYHVGRAVPESDVSNVLVRTTGPKGCGLGSSGSLSVAVVGLAAPDMALHELVQIAHGCENASGNDCGYQDHLAAAYGGANLVTFPLSIDQPSPADKADPLFSWLESSCSLWLSSSPRSSGSLVEGVLARYARADASTIRGLESLVHAFPAVRTAIVERSVHVLISAVREVFRAQSVLGEVVVPPEVDVVVRQVERRFGGAAKVEGGGGTGSAILVCQPPNADQAALHRFLGSCGYLKLDMNFSADGLLRGYIR